MNSSLAHILQFIAPLQFSYHEELVLRAAQGLQLPGLVQKKGQISLGASLANHVTDQDSMLARIVSDIIDYH
eukprot:1160963-Pelagomonas_calceolata.AAC.13